MLLCDLVLLDLLLLSDRVLVVVVDLRRAVLELLLELLLLLLLELELELELELPLLELELLELPLLDLVDRLRCVYPSDCSASNSRHIERTVNNFISGWEWEVTMVTSCGVTMVTTSNVTMVTS